MTRADTPTMAEALDQMVDHAKHQADLDPKAYEQLGVAVETIFAIAKRSGFQGGPAGVIEDFIVNQLGFE